MTREEALKNLENQIDYFTYELKRSIVNSAITGHQSSNVWDKFKGFMQNLYHGKNNPKNPNFTKSVLGHGLGKQANENKHVPLKNYRFFKEWHETLEHSLNLINEDYKTPELPSHIKNTQLNKIIDDWSVKFKRAILSTIGLVLGTEVPTGVLKDIPVSSGKFGASVGDGQFGGNKATSISGTGSGNIPNAVGNPSADPSAAGGGNKANTVSTGVTGPTGATVGDTGATGATGGDPNATGGVPPVVPAGNLKGSIDTKDLEEAFEKYNNWKFKIKIKMKASGGGGMPILNQQLLIKGKPKIEITGGLPYVLKFGSPIIDLIYHSDEERYKNLVKLGRIETREDQFDEITDEQKKQIIKKSAEYKLSEKTLDPTYKKNIENILNNASNVELEEFIESLKDFSGTPKKPKPTNTSDTTNTPEPVNKNAIKLETKEFLQKALNLQDDAKFSVYINKNNQNLRNYLENIFNNNKQEFVEEIKKNISLPEEEKVQIEKLNELDLDQFIEGFVRIMGIALVYKIISPLSTSSDDGLEKIIKLDKKKLATILKNLNEDYLVNYFIELSIDKIKELSEVSEVSNTWQYVEKYKNYTIEQLKNSLEKIDNVKELLDEIKEIFHTIAEIPRS